MTQVLVSGNGNNINEKYDKFLKNADKIGDNLSEKGQLTDEDIETIAETINSVDSPGSELLEKAKEEASKPQQNTSSTANVVINPVTGKPMSIVDFDDEDDDIHLQSFEEMMADPTIKPMDIDITKVEISQDDVKNALAGYGTDKDFSVDDYNKIIEAANRYKKKEKFSYYVAMPDCIKIMIDRVISTDLELASKMGNFRAEARNYVASELLRDVVTSATTNTALIDLDKFIKTSQAKASIEIKRDDYWRSTREYFLKTLPTIIEKMVSDGKGDQADVLTKAREAFIQSYTYTDMMDKYKSGKIRVKKIQIEKFEKTCRDFNTRYQKSQNIITELSLALSSLDRHAPKHYDIDVLKEFLCIFVNYTRNMDPNNKIDHVFMYYFIYNITTLDFYNKENEEDVAFHDELLNNIDTCLKDIIEFRNNKKE